MHLDDLDVERRAERARRRLDERQQHVDAHAHVGGEHDRDLAAESAERRLLRGIESGRADDGRDPLARARGEVRQRAVRAREVDEDVGARERRIDVGGDRDAGDAPAGSRPRRDPTAGLPATSSAAREREPRLRQHRLDQRAAHPAAGAGDGDPDVGHRQGTGLAAGS